MVKSTKNAKKSKKTDVKTEKNTKMPKSVKKHPKEGSMLAVILEKFPSEGEYSMDEILALIREGNSDMQAKKDSSLRTVVKELVKEKGKASPHINRYSFLKFDETSKKFKRV